MEQHFEYPANVEEDASGFYLVTFPDFPEAATDARSRDAALLEAMDCLEEAVAGRMKRGDGIPIPSPVAKGMVPIALPTLYSMKAALYVAMREARLSQSASQPSWARTKRRCDAFSILSTRAASQRWRQRCIPSENGCAW
jgi:predicted RNase H-like HicB family nuclease